MTQPGPSSEKVFVLIDGTSAFTKAVAHTPSPAQSAFRAAVAHTRERKEGRYYPSTILLWSNRNDEWLTPGHNGINPARFQAMAKVIDDNMGALSGTATLSHALAQLAQKLPRIMPVPQPPSTRLIIVTAPAVTPHLREWRDKAILKALDALTAACPDITVDMVVARNTKASPFISDASREETVSLMELAAQRKNVVVYPCTTDPAEINTIVDMLLRDRSRVIPPTPRFRTVIAPKV